ncbi:MAG: Hpt domain-containing protein [Magnetospirillum sp.]|nr:Hpt domain-containing protein [Magnetospirillum sp.]
MPGDWDDDLGIDPEALARAEAALDALSSHYLSWAEADLASLQDALAQLQAQPDAPAPLARLFTISHDMKGQAATFGYPLLTHIGERLCRFIETHPAPDGAALIRLADMVQAISQVLTLRMEGDGGAAGRDLLTRLDT